MIDFTWPEVLCGNSCTNDPQLGFNRFPSAQKNPERRALWLSVFGKSEDYVTFNSHVNAKLSPFSTVGK